MVNELIAHLPIQRLNFILTEKSKLCPKKQNIYFLSPKSYTKYFFIILRFFVLPFCSRFLLSLFGCHIYVLFFRSRFFSLFLLSLFLSLFALAFLLSLFALTFLVSLFHSHLSFLSKDR